MARPRTPLSSYGTIHTVKVEDKKWRARTRYRFDDGKLRQVERFAASESKAKTALRAALTEIQTSTAVDIKRETRIRDLGERYLTSKSGRAPRTLETYERSVRKVIVPRIGDLAVSEATTERLQRFLDVVQAENGPGEAKKARAVLSGMMGLATRSDALKTNPVRELAAIEAKAKGATAIPLAELPVLLENVGKDDRLRTVDMVDVIVFLAGTGVRITEALSLDWDDVDLKAGTVAIRKSKTEAGERRIKVPAGVVKMLRARRRRPFSWGHENGPDGIVFPTVLGKRRDRHNAAGEWREYRERAKLPDSYTFHAFRKSVATALDQAGLTPRDVAEYLGHANPALTMSTYMSKTVGGSRAADALDYVMSGITK